MTMTRAIFASDNDGHEYLIPLHKYTLFILELSKDEEFEDYNELDDIFGKYRVEGDYEIYANFE